LTTATERPAAHPRYDPTRRDRIIDSCLDVIAEHGVAGASHRKIAAAAGVPLGSMTYHFDGFDDLLRAAFGRYAESVSAQFEERMQAASDLDEARTAVVTLITEVVLGTRRDLVLLHELYTLAARDESYRTLTSAWMSRSRAALERHFDPMTARLIDALIEGLSLHRALDTTPHDPEIARIAIERITRTETAAPAR